MRDVEKKAARLVNQGAVQVDYWRVTNDRIAYATGRVVSEHGEYVVTIEPDRDICDCMYGFNQPGLTHSHTAAMRLAVWNIARKEQ